MGATFDLLDFSASEERAGFRLQRLEVLNWGTFDGRVWSFQVDGRNALLTGDIGSGKSTLVDALTTLLVPAHRVAYNRAAGAELKERTLRSYVLGHWRAQRGDSGGSAKPVALRDASTVSIILGHFFNEGMAQHVTLAQVFWLKDPDSPPARLYVVATEALSIATHLAGFGSEIAQLRKRLRALKHVEMFDSFPGYGAAFKRHFGIDSDQALELFHQTVSMKSVGNLTDFVRDHMLEQHDVEERIAALLRHYDDLNRAHEAVLLARRQIEALKPLVADGREHAELVAAIRQLDECREALPAWFGQLRLGLIETRRKQVEVDLRAAQSELASIKARIEERNRERDAIRSDIARNGGDRLEWIDQELARQALVRDERKARAERYEASARALELPSPADAAAFARNQEALALLAERLRDERSDLQNRLVELGIQMGEDRRAHDEVSAELESLSKRRSNIDARMLAMREHLARSVGVDEAELPFVGELIRVRPDEQAWRGAIERVLRSFALSILVKDELYERVSKYVDQTHLGQRLVYLRVRKVRDRDLDDGVAEPASLVRKLDINPACPALFRDWLNQELRRRFDYQCCDSVEELRRVQQGLTRRGQVKHGPERHEKDDRHRVDDASRYVLGWSNEEKRRELETRRDALEKKLQRAGEEYARCQKAQDRVLERTSAVERLGEYPRFEDLDWRMVVGAIDDLRKERAALAKASSVLESLQQRLKVVDDALKALEDDREAATKRAEGASHELQRLMEQADESRAALEELAPEARERLFLQLDVYREQALGDEAITLRNADIQREKMARWLQKRAASTRATADELGQRIVAAMQAYKNAHPAATQEVDANLAALPEFERMLAGLENDGLPKFEARFRQLLSEQTVVEIANFHSQLNKQKEQVTLRIAEINRSLENLEYNPGRYIQLEPSLVQDSDIRDFQQQLRECTTGGIGSGEDGPSVEEKFEAVKRIIDRFRGREGSVETDRRWTARVTDVRNWYAFGASERYRETGEEHEHYADSGGKSGGQKEKLAYTVLAASLAYQFGLKAGARQSRSFRFVVIDEAFGRGSDESARFGLQLFEKLNLQVLVVTPLQKIHVIEPFVSSVGFVDNPNGNRSRLRTLTIEEFRREQAARAG